jgi:hypothetical protein
LTEFAFVAKVTATGEVRDKDGNLISTQPIEAEIPLTEEQAHALLEGTSE